MGSLRRSAALQFAFLAIFALVSLIHGPAMALAVAAGSSQTAHVMSDANSHHNHGAHGVPANPAAEIPADGTLCPMLGCSMALGPVAPQAAVTWLAMGRIETRPSPALRAVIFAPADPPPRLSV